MWTRVEMPRGVLWHRSEGAVLESVAVGELDESGTAVMTRELERLWKQHGWCAAFHNWERSTGYTTRFRLDWMRWATSPAARAARFSHFRLNNSPLLKMAVSVASIAFAPQQFTVHETSAGYAAARLAHLKPPTPLPGDH